MRSTTLEVMAALPLDGSLGLRPEEDYTYADQPWNPPFLFGMSCGAPCKQAAALPLGAVWCMLTRMVVACIRV
eukprot:COSAG02_NODE_1344_length_13159_cov_10.788208_8_plen_73_part_00